MAPISSEKILDSLLVWFSENGITYEESKIQVKIEAIESCNETLATFLNRHAKNAKNVEFNQLTALAKSSSTLSKIHGPKDSSSSTAIPIKEGFGVVSIRNIKENQTVVRIPKKSVISAKNSPLTNIFDDEGISGELALVIAVMFEMSLKQKSQHWGYIQSLPYSVDIPLLWPESQQALLVGTEAFRLLQEDLARLKADFVVLSDLVSKYPYIFGEVDNSPNDGFMFGSFDEFLRVTSLVSSRAFHVDDFLGHSMVPFADLFNHKSGDEDVHVVCDTDICLLCGELYGCEHKNEEYRKASQADQDSKSGEVGMSDEPQQDSEDSESSERWDDESVEGSDSSAYDYDFESSDDSGEEMPLLLNRSDEPVVAPVETTQKSAKRQIIETEAEYADEKTAAEPSNSLDDILEVVTEKPVKKGGEIFNTYGIHSCGYFLHRYGFVDPVNVQYETCLINHSKLMDAFVGKNCVRSKLDFVFLQTKEFFKELSKYQEDLNGGYFEEFEEQLWHLVAAHCGDKSDKAHAKVNVNANADVNASASSSTSNGNIVDGLLSDLNIFLFQASGHPNYSFLVFLTLLSSEEAVINYLYNACKEDISLVAGQLQRLSMFWAIWCNCLEHNKYKPSGKEALDFANQELSQLETTDGIDGSENGRKNKNKSRKRTSQPALLSSKVPTKKQKRANSGALSLKTLSRVCEFVVKAAESRATELRKNQKLAAILPEDCTDDIQMSRWLRAATVHRSEELMLEKTIKKYKKAQSSLKA